MSASPSRKRAGPPPANPLGHKRRRLDLADLSPHAAVTAPLQLQNPADALALVRVETTSTVVVHSAPQPAPSALDDLRKESHDIAREIAQKQLDDSQTGKTYQRRWDAYIEWWEAFAEERHHLDTTNPLIPALPVTATKVVHFLNHERSRERKHGRTADGTQQFRAGTSIGKSSISQIITALEYLRHSTQSRFPNDLEARSKLRDDDRIRKIETASKHDEPKRMEKSQTLKAAGTSQDTYTADELVKLSLHCLKSPTTAHQAEILIRDRTMLLLACATAFRGGNVRALQWSDLFMQFIENVAAGPGKKIPALSIFADNAKHNQLGRVDEHGALRHCKPELCAIGALAMHFFTVWHVKQQPLPSFAPDFSDDAARAGYGTGGRREWYSYLLFPGNKGPSTEMSFDNHAERIKLLHKQNNVNIVKVTHAARPFTAQTTRQHGASQADAKALGGWQESGSYRAAYDRQLPLAALVGAAMFNANQPGDYFVLRSSLDPPPGVVAQIFPWVEGELAAHDVRVNANRNARDMALTRFLKLLQWLRVVLVQDLAVLWSVAPEFSLFNHAPFSSEEFRRFADGTEARLRDVKKRINDGLKRVPEEWRASVRALQMEEAARNEQFRIKVLDHLDQLHVQPNAGPSRARLAASGPINNPKAFVPPEMRIPVPLAPPPPAFAPVPTFVTPLPPWSALSPATSTIAPAMVSAATVTYPAGSASTPHPRHPFDITVPSNAAVSPVPFSLVSRTPIPTPSAPRISPAAHSLGLVLLLKQHR